MIVCECRFGEVNVVFCLLFKKFVELKIKIRIGYFQMTMKMTTTTQTIVRMVRK